MMISRSRLLLLGLSTWWVVPMDAAQDRAAGGDSPPSTRPSVNHVLWLDGRGAHLTLPRGVFRNLRQATVEGHSVIEHAETKKAADDDDEAQTQALIDELN